MLNEKEEASRGDAPTWLDLYNYRRRVAALYNERERALIGGEDERDVVARFREGRDSLFARHPQSALNAKQRGVFGGLHYFPYNPEMRVEAVMTPLPPTDRVIEAADGPHMLTLRPAASVEFAIGGSAQKLTVFWIDVYGGGLFLPFRDLTCPAESYGGGRYLFDTVKGSNFLGIGENGGLFGIGSSAKQGYVGGRVLLDFNYAYNPSCAYDSRWVCPLAPVENRLKVRIAAGEKKFAED